MVEDFFPFSKDDIGNFGAKKDDGESEELRKEKEKRCLELVAWIAVHLIRCVIDGKILKGKSSKLLSENQLQDIASWDDVAFCMLMAEDSLEVWKEMAITELCGWGESDAGGEEPAKKKIRRSHFKALKKFEKGNGISGKVAQNRYASINLALFGYARNPLQLNELEKTFKEAALEYEKRYEVKKPEKSNAAAGSDGDMPPLGGEGAVDLDYDTMFCEMYTPMHHPI